MRAARMDTRTMAKACRPLEMTKWFDTNYHYLVPEFTAGQAFHSPRRKPCDEFREAKARGHSKHGPFCSARSPICCSARREAPTSSPYRCLPRLLPLYAEMLRPLGGGRCAWVQIDEPCLVLDLSDTARAAFGALTPH